MGVIEISKCQSGKAQFFSNNDANPDRTKYGASIEQVWSKYGESLAKF